MRRMKTKFAVVGCGRVGISLARHLTKAGYRPVGFASRTLASAKRGAEAAAFGGKVSSNPWEITDAADIVFISTPDHAISDTASRIAEHQGVKEGAVVLHCSGALSSEILSAVNSAGGKTGSMHPLQSFAAEEMEANPFAGIMMGIEGDTAAVQSAWAVAEALGATPFEIHTESKMLYHASAVVASNYLVTLMNLAFQLLFASGVRSSNVYQILKPLINGTLGNIENSGVPRALTGPIARGDTTVVEAHVDQIREKAPTLLPLYKSLGRQTIDIALAKETLSRTAAEKLRALLKEEPE
ncbi:MAG: Rossmann-like and DUF2520 domain-containing protein [Thermodesulfobacteriota bacterium]